MPFEQSKGSKIVISVEYWIIWVTDSEITNELILIRIVHMLGSEIITRCIFFMTPVMLGAPNKFMILEKEPITISLRCMIRQFPLIKVNTTLVTGNTASLVLKIQTLEHNNHLGIIINTAMTNRLGATIYLPMFQNGTLLVKMLLIDLVIVLPMSRGPLKITKSASTDMHNSSTLITSVFACSKPTTMITSHLTITCNVIRNFCAMVVSDGGLFWKQHNLFPRIPYYMLSL